MISETETTRPSGRPSELGVIPAGCLEEHDRLKKRTTSPPRTCLRAEEVTLAGSRSPASARALFAPAPLGGESTVRAHRVAGECPTMLGRIELRGTRRPGSEHCTPRASVLVTQLRRPGRNPLRGDVDSGTTRWFTILRFRSWVKDVLRIRAQNASSLVSFAVRNRSGTLPPASRRSVYTMKKSLSGAWMKLSRRLVTSSSVAALYCT